MDVRIKKLSSIKWIVQVKYSFFLVPYWKTVSFHTTEKDAEFYCDFLRG